MSISDSADVPENLQPNFNELLKKELAKLQKEYRRLDTKRHGIAQLEGIINCKTKRVLPLLHRNREELTHELINATSRHHQDVVATYSATIKEALQTYDLYQVEIKRTIKHVKQTEKMVDMIIDKVLKQRMKLTCSFNMQINANKQLREEINDFLQDRHSFFKVHNHLKRQITLTKRKMLHVVQLAMRSYDNREEAMIKIRAIREREDKERKQHGMDLQEFERTLHHDQQMLAFIKLKATHRPPIEDARERKMRLATAREVELDSILRKYRLSFKRILSYSEDNKIPSLLAKYQAMDTANYELFIYLTNLNSECEVLKESIDHLKSEIELADAAIVTRQKEQRQKQRQLQLATIGEHDKVTATEAQVKKNKSKLDVILGAIGSAFVLAECNREPVMLLLGNTSKGITVHNVRLCLALLDLKLTEMKTERDNLRDVRATGTVTNFLKSTTLGKGHVQNSGGPFFPKVMVFHVEALEEDDPRILEREPYYYDQLREYMYDKMVAEKLINPEGRVVTTPDSERRSTLKKAGKSLLETVKSRFSDVEAIVQRTRKSMKAGNVSRSASEPNLRGSNVRRQQDIVDLQAMLEKYPAQDIFSKAQFSARPSSGARLPRRTTTKSLTVRLPDEVPSQTNLSDGRKPSTGQKEK